MKRTSDICFACGQGHYHEVMDAYRVTLPEGDSVLVPHVMLLRCQNCGDEIIPPDSSRQIEAAVDRAQETLSPGEAQAFLDFFNIDQTEASIALGMGAKTFHRWVKGTQRVSRSMGFFLRALMAHPEVFQWIRDRRWKHTADTAVHGKRDLGHYWEADYNVRFPASYSSVHITQEVSTSVSPKRFNAARGLLAVEMR